MKNGGEEASERSAWTSFSSMSPFPPAWVSELSLLAARRRYRRHEDVDERWTPKTGRFSLSTNCEHLPHHLLNRRALTKRILQTSIRHAHNIFFEFFVR